MPNTTIDPIAAEQPAAVKTIEDLIRVHGLDFVLRVCARMAMEREAAFRAVQAFTGKAGK